MNNPNNETPNFILLQQTDNKGPIFKVTICKSTLTVLSEEILHEIPSEWSIQDFYDLLEEGKRFYKHTTESI